jgi:hypothetical protein
MRDLPEGPALLAIARDVLLNDLMPLLPSERRLDALLVANCMAIAEREGDADGALAETIARELEMVHGAAALTQPALRAGSPLSRIAGEGPERSEGGEGASRSEGGEGEADEGPTELLRRFARELRIGAFENSPDREARARAMLWRLTIARLRLANPKFLAANGFS